MSKKQANKNNNGIVYSLNNIDDQNTTLIALIL